MTKRDQLWIGLIAGAAVLYLLYARSQSSSTSPNLTAGQGADPFDESAYTVDAFAQLAGLL